MNEIKKGNQYTVEFTSLTHEGLGVCRVSDIPVFVFNAIPGEKAKIEITEMKKTFCFGKVVELLSKSKTRVAPICPLYGKCGGCNFMHLGYESQVEAKVDIFKQTLKRIGKFENVAISNVLKAEDQYYYRNKVNIFFEKEKDDLVYGFYRRETHQIEPLDKCFLFDDLISGVLKSIKELALLDEDRGFITSVSFRINEKKEILVGFDVSKRKNPFLKYVVSEILKRHREVISIVVGVEGKYNTYFGKGRIIESLMDFKFSIAIDDFFQINKKQTEKLYSKILEYAGDNLGNVVDGFCGIGTISLGLSKEAEKVYGIEMIETSVKNAIKNKEVNNVLNVEYILGKTEYIIKDIKDKDIEVDLIVVDPPRRGCDSHLLNTIVEMGIKKIIYVSCDPGTLARDLKVLKENGYEVKDITLVDMFPNTSHIEAVVSVSKI